MAHLTPITDAADPRLADYVSLRDTQLRHSLEVEHGLFIAEGTKIIERAARAGLRPRSLMVTERWWQGLRPLFEAVDVPVWVVTEKLAEQVTGFHVHRGALGSFARPAMRPLEEFGGLRRLVVAEDIVDHTNMGAIIRCAAGLGWDGVVLSPRCADPLYRRSVKTAMGTVFDLPWTRLGEREDLAWLKTAGFTLVALALAPGALPIREVADRVRDAKVAILLGTEGDGLSADWLGMADLVATIPMHRGVDSLNVAAAAAIACHDLG